jgi:hypothetical protein
MTTDFAYLAGTRISAGWREVRRNFLRLSVMIEEPDGSIRIVDCFAESRNVDGIRTVRIPHYQPEALLRAVAPILDASNDPVKGKLSGVSIEGFNWSITRHDGGDVMLEGVFL